MVATDLDRIVSEIRTFIDMPTSQPTPPLVQAAADYAQACQEANERLARCAALLRRGLRSEALQLARTGPELLDQLAQLNFRSRGTWDALAADYQLPAAPSLDLSAAQELNHAYALEQPLEEVLKQHRLAALGRAPLGQRLGILRRIAELDPANPLWWQDLRVFEQARLKEMEAAAAWAERDEDLAALDAMNRELSQASWSVTPPPALVNRVETSLRTLIVADAHEQLTRLEAELAQASSASDLRRSRQLCAEVEQTIAEAALPDDDPVVRRLKEPLDWVEHLEHLEERRKQLRQAVRQLEAALEASAPLPELQAQYQQCRGYGELPADVEVRYVERLDQIYKQHRQTRFLVSGAATLLLALLGTATVYWYQTETHLRQVTQVETEVRTYLEDGRLAKARERFDQARRDDPSLAGDPGLIKLSHELEDAEEAEGVRAVRFWQDHRAVLALGHDEPVKEARLDGLRQAAVTTEEVAAVEELRSELSLHRLNALKQQNQQVFRRLQAFKDELDELPLSVVNTRRVEANGKALARLRSSIEEVPLEVERLEPHVEEVLQSTRRALTSARQRLATSRQQVEDLEQMHRALQAWDLDQYRERMRAFVDVHRESLRAIRFSDSLNDFSVWKAMVAWHTLWEGLNTASLTVPSARRSLPELASFWKEHKEVVQRHPHLFGAGQFAAYHEALTAVGMRQGEADLDSGVNAELRGALTGPLVENLWLMETTDGQRFYLPEKLDLKGAIDFVQFDYVSGFDGSIRTDLLRREKIARVNPAPQSQLVDEVRGAFVRLRDETWEEAVLLAMEVIRNKKNLDPIFGVILLRKFARLAGQGSAFLKSELAFLEPQIQQLKIDLTVPWMQPIRDDAKRVRTAARKFLDGLPNFTNLTEKVARKRDLVRDATTGSEWILAGWLLEDPEEGWQVRLVRKLSPVRRYELGVLAVGDGGEPAEWVGVGEHDNGKTALATMEPSLREGCLVFARVVLEDNADE